MSDYEQCERCGRDAITEDMHNITLSDEWYICVGCVEALNDSVEYHDWQDRYTEEQHERAVTLLSEQDEIECVISSYEGGKIIIHTNYVSSKVVSDFCQHFGFEIVAFGPEWEEDSNRPCIYNHGSTFEILLAYTKNSNPPIPLSIPFEPSDVNELDESDEQF